MDLVLKRRKDDNEHEPLLVSVIDEENKKKIIKSVRIGETLSLDDHLAHLVLGQYKGCFEIKAPEYRTKIMKPAAD